MLYRREILSLPIVPRPGLERHPFPEAAKSLLWGRYSGKLTRRPTLKFCIYSFPLLSAYQESYTFDKNGNLKTLTRNGPSSKIDDFTYYYQSEENNRLMYVADNPALHNNSVTDIDNQATTNYGYNDHWSAYQRRTGADSEY